MAGDKLSDSKLQNVVNNEKDVVIGLVVAAKLVEQPNWSGNLGVSPTHPPAVADGTAAEATIPESGAVEGGTMFADAELDEEEECGWPLHAVGWNTQVRCNYTTPHKTQMIDTTINLLVNRTECTNLSGTTLMLRLAVKNDNSSPAILFRDSEKLDATIKLSLTLPTHSCHCPHGQMKSC